MSIEFPDDVRERLEPQDWDCLEQGGVLPKKRKKQNREGDSSSNLASCTEASLQKQREQKVE